MALLPQEPEELECIYSEPQIDIIESRAAVILDMAGQGGGKTELIGLLSGMMVNDFPKCKGFIGANTDIQLSQTTLNRVFKIWKRVFGFTQYDPKFNVGGHYVIDKVPPPHFLRNEELKGYYNTISFKNGAMIFVGNLNNYLAHDGKEFAYAHLDETKDTKEEALTTVIFARLRQFGLWFNKEGEVIFDDTVTPREQEERGLTGWNPCYIHTSPSEGGVDWLIKMFGLADHEQEIRKRCTDPYDYFHKVIGDNEIVIYSTFWNEENLRPGYIQQRLNQLSENQALKFIYSYPFSKSGGEYYPNFSRLKTVRHLPFLRDKAVSLTYDFNVVPYYTQLAAQVIYTTQWVKREGKAWIRREEAPYGELLEEIDLWEEVEVMQIRFYKEYCMVSPDDSGEAAVGAFDADMQVMDASPDVLVYGDATGRGRIIGLGGSTQYSLIQPHLYKYISDGWLRVGLTNLLNLKRRELMNRIFEDKIPDVQVLIDPSCEELLRDCEYVKLNSAGDGKNPEKKDGRETIGHTSDAMEYLVCELCKDYLKEA